jgi:hypothetical protein
LTGRKTQISAHVTDPADRADVEHVADVVELYVDIFRQIDAGIRQ